MAVQQVLEVWVVSGIPDALLHWRHALLTVLYYAFGAWSQHMIGESRGLWDTVAAMTVQEKIERLGQCYLVPYCF